MPKKNPFNYNRQTKFYLVFPSGHVGFWGFRDKPNAESFTGPSPTGGGKITVVEATSRKKAQEVVNGPEHSE